MSFKIPEPELQVSFAQALAEIRQSMLQDALRETVRSLDIPSLDRELAEIVPSHSLATLAGHGLRGELMFAVPSVLAANPRLVGYYRLLYGFSQKEFHKPGIGSQFRAAEIGGRLSKTSTDALPAFCKAMAEAGTLLLAGISAGQVSAALLDDLTLLTLGPQLRGGANVAIGTAAIHAVFGVIKEIVGHAIDHATSTQMALKNAAGRDVFIEFASDPDIIIREKLPSGAFRHIIAVEVKGGRDFSNVHNRIGEAEKSHQKARASGYTECWTVVNVDNIDLVMAKRESPSTDRFYKISDLIAATGSDFSDFHDRVISLTGIRSHAPN
jgi:hypothetical protein